MNITHTTFSINLGSDWSVENDGQYLAIKSGDKCAYLKATEINSFCIDEGGVACISTKHALYRLILRAGDKNSAPSRDTRDLLNVIHTALASKQSDDALNEDG